MKEKKTYFQRLQQWLQRNACGITGCRYRWRVRFTYRDPRTGRELFWMDSTISMNCSDLINEPRDLKRAHSVLRKTIEQHRARCNGEILVCPLAYLGWF